MKKSMESVIEKLESTKTAISEKLESKGYVVAGYGGDTYYAYVGKGKGYQGAALAPVSSNPVVFDTVQAANREAHNGTYSNGQGDVIRLEVVEASKYFAKIYADAEKTIAQVREFAE